MLRFARPTPIPKLLRALFQAETPLNKYQIEKESKVSRGTVYNWISRMKRLGWIEVASTGRSRVGLPVEYYRLTELGYFRVATSNPDLTAKVRNVLGDKFKELKEKAAKTSLDRFREELRLAEEVYMRKTAPPNWTLKIELRADKNGRVWHSYSIGIEV